ncbi:TRAP transporter substrate-binding protein [Acidimangrovimonas sediminis]|uniref:TRAP transporter substrate-binding protein n=1 Tax=Acidimangrovimonas sediminis TaxID=2056283 RepID=UPI000C7FD350|nr:TRAP transporter substrate-binding protein [Acidimangrovimonas sediminis]
MFARKIIAAAVLGTVMATGGAASAKELSFANFMPSNHPYVGSTFQPFADQVSKLTDGKVTVKLYNGGELGAGPVQQYNRVVDGVADLAVSLPGYTASQFPLTLLSELPGVLEEKTGTEDIYKNLGLFKHDYRRVHLVALWSSAENVLFTRDKAVRSPADLKGMKIRVPSRATGLMVEAWGGSPVSMPVTQIYNAMQTGVLDGAMIDGTGVNAFKLNEVSKYITMGMKTTISPFFIIINRDAYAGLTPDQQKAVDEAGKDAAMHGLESQLKVAEAGFRSFAAEPGKEVIHLTADQAAAFDKLSVPVTEEVVKKTGGDAQKIVDALKADQ